MPQFQKCLFKDVEMVCVEIQFKIDQLKNTTEMKISF